MIMIIDDYDYEYDFDHNFAFDYVINVASERHARFVLSSVFVQETAMRFCQRKYYDMWSIVTPVAARGC